MKKQASTHKQFSERTEINVLPSSWWYAMSRYDFAMQQFDGKNLVLDIGCGKGMGIDYLIGHGAGVVVGLDYDFQSVRFAMQRFPHKQMCLLQSDVVNLPFRNNSVRNICCLEVIEHINLDKNLLAELARILHPEGVIVISTPNKSITSPSTNAPLNPFHIREYYPAQFYNLLSCYFGTVKLLGQHESESISKYRQTIARHRTLFSSKWVQRLKNYLPPAFRQRFKYTLYSVSSGVKPHTFSAADFCFLENQVGTSPVTLAICTNAV